MRGVYSEYNMAFNYFGACTKSASCMSATCPGAFTGSNTMDGDPVQCLGSDVGVSRSSIIIREPL